MEIEYDLYSALVSGSDEEKKRTILFKKSKAAEAIKQGVAKESVKRKLLSMDQHERTRVYF